MHPRAYFDVNPYSSDKLPKRGGSATLPSRKDDSKPFKPSSPGKKVCVQLSWVYQILGKIISSTC